MKIEVDQISETGIYVDLKNGHKVVSSPPDEGIQLVAPGGEITANLKAEIDRWLGGGEVESTDGVAVGDEKAAKKAAAAEKRAAAKAAKTTETPQPAAPAEPAGNPDDSPPVETPDAGNGSGD